MSVIFGTVCFHYLPSVITAATNVTHESSTVIKCVLIILRAEFELFIALHIAPVVIVKFLSEGSWQLSAQPCVCSSIK